jgi:hypothetical protein
MAPDNAGRPMKGPDPSFGQPRSAMTVIADGLRLPLHALPGAWLPILLTVIIYFLIGPVMKALTGIDPFDLGFGVPVPTELMVAESSAQILAGLYALLNMLLLLWVFAMLLQYLQQAASCGDQLPLSPGAALRRVPAMVGASMLFGLTLVITVALMTSAFVALDGQFALVLMLAVLLIGSLLTLVLMLGPALPALENTGPIASLTRSAKLVWPHWLFVSWVLFLVFLLNIALTLVLGLVIMLLVQLIHAGTLSALLGWVINPVLGVFYLLFTAGLTVSLYYDLLARRAVPGKDG